MNIKETGDEDKDANEPVTDISKVRDGVAELALGDGALRVPQHEEVGMECRYDSNLPDGEATTNAVVEKKGNKANTKASQNSKQNCTNSRQWSCGFDWTEAVRHGFDKTKASRQRAVRYSVIFSQGQWSRVSRFDSICNERITTD